MSRVFITVVCFSAACLSTMAACSRTFPGDEPSPLNQDRFACVDVDLENSRQVTFADSTLGSGNEMTGSCGGERAPERVYLWEVPADGIYRIETTGSGFDTVLYLFNGGCSADEVVCNDDAPGADVETSVIDIEAEAGAQLVIAVDGWDRGEGSFQLRITPR